MIGGRKMNFLSSTNIARAIATLLASAGLAWALLLIPVAMGFVLGYVIWFGWIVRAFGKMHSSLSPWLWLSSIAYNGYWVITATRESADVALVVYTAWWCIAVLLSAVALYFDLKPRKQIKSTQTARLRNSVSD
jgi:hypothetical protein